MSGFTLQNIKHFEEECRAFLQNYVPFDEDRCFVAGGFFQRFWHGFPIRDIDIYAKQGYFDECARELVHTGFEKQLVGKHQEFIKFKAPHELGGLEVDLIGFHKPRSKDYVFASFDFSCCMLCMDADNFYTGKFGGYELLQEMAEKRLVFNTNCRLNLGKNNNTLTRLKKYMDMGYTIDEKTLTDIYLTLIKANPKKVKEMNYPG